MNSHNFKRLIVFLIITISLIIFGAFNNYYQLLTIILISIIAMFFYHLVKYPFDNISVLMFLVSMFTFIFFKPISNLVTDTPPHYSITITVNTLLIVLVGVISLILGVIMEKKISCNLGSANNSFLIIRDDSLVKSSLLMVITTSFFTFYNTYTNIRDVLGGGYIALYAENSTTIVERIANFNTAFIYIYLATLPPKNIFYKSLFLIIPLLVSDFFTGRRGIAVIHIIILISYYFLRVYVIEKKSINIKVSNIILLLFIGIIVIILSTIVSQIRLGNEIDMTYPLSTFFHQMSEQYNFIESTLFFRENLLESDYGYTWQAIYNGSYITRLLTFNGIFGSSSSSSFNHNLGSALTFFRDPVYYASGGSFGTSYLAELYIDYSYTGLVVYNLILGYFLSSVNKLIRKNWIVFSLVLFILKTLYFIPRESAFNWVSQLLSVTNIMAILIVLIFSKTLPRIKGEFYEKYKSRNSI